MNQYIYTSGNSIISIDIFGLCEISGYWGFMDASIDSYGLCNPAKDGASCFYIDSPWPWQSYYIYGEVTGKYTGNIYCQEDCVCPSNPRRWVLTTNSTHTVDRIPIPVGNGCKAYKLYKPAYLTCMIAKYSDVPENIRELDDAVQTLGKKKLDEYVDLIEMANDPDMWCKQVTHDSGIYLHMPTIGIH